MKKILMITRDPLVNFRQMKDHGGITDNGEYQFVINDFDCQPDFVVVMSKGLRVPASFNVPKSHTILLTSEPYSILDYPKGYCSQFGTVLACQRELKADSQTHILHTQAMLPWFVGVTFGRNGEKNFSLTYEDIEKIHPKKEKLISVISSNKAFSQGHVDRLRFIRKLQEHYGDKVDVFGRGFKDFADKWDVLAPYRYHIVIENSSSDYYWTEKLADCYLAETYPIYHGCTNIQEFFPQEALTPVDIRNFDQTAATIDRVIAEDLEAKRKDVLLESKQLVLGKYNLFTFVAEVCRTIDSHSYSLPSGGLGWGSSLLKPASKFFSWHNLYLYSIGRTFHKLSAQNLKT